jgi:hypothetical protein
MDPISLRVVGSWNTSTSLLMLGWPVRHRQ